MGRRAAVSQDRPPNPENALGADPPDRRIAAVETVLVCGGDEIAALRHHASRAERQRLAEAASALGYRNLAAMLFAYPDHAARHYLIGRELVVPKVISLFKKARELDPKNFPLAADAAMAYLATQPLQSMEAIAAWNEALALAPDDRSKQGVQIHLARIHAHIGETDKAREILKAVKAPKLVVLKDEILKKLDAPAAPAPAEP